MDKIILKIGMIVMALLSFLPMTAYDFEVDGIQYEIISTADLTCRTSGLGDTSLSTINIPATVEYKGKELTVVSVYGFAGTDIEEVTLPNTCTSIGGFEDCKNLKKISIPSSLTSISSYAFEDCTSLSEIHLPPTLSYIGKSAFSGCTNLENVHISDLKAWCNISFTPGWCYSEWDTYTSNPLSNGKAKLLVDDTLLTCLNTNELDIDKIEAGCFVGYQYLTSVLLDDNITSVGEYAFWNCSNLKYIQIGKNIEQIPYACFGECPNLSEVYISDSESPLLLHASEYSYYDYNGAFRGSNLKNVYIGRDLTCLSFSSSATHVYSPFQGQNIEYVEIGPLVNSITKFYFFGVYTSSGSGSGVSIQNLTIDESTESIKIDSESFKNIDLVSLFIGRDFNSTTKVTSYLPGCKSLENLTIGKYVTKVKYFGFDQNPNISKIECFAINPPSSGEFAKDTYLDASLIVPYGSKDEYSNANIWKNFWNISEMELSGIAEITSNSELINFELTGNGIKSLCDNKFDIYRIDGQKIVSRILYNGEILTLHPGIYLVCCDNKFNKISIR